MSSSSNTNQAYVLHGPSDARFEQNWPTPPSPGPDQVLLRTLSAGICGSDVRYVREAKLEGGNIPISSPMVLGHEASAEVAAVGSNVTHLAPGDLVTYEPAITCLQCVYCVNRDYNLCVNTARIFPPYSGSLTNYFLHHSNFTYKLPPHVDPDEAALIEPITIAVHACKRAGVTVGSKVFITGAGPIGLITLITAQAFGALQIVITDVNEARLKLAKELGATGTILVSKDQTEDDLKEEVKRLFGDGTLASQSFECSGVLSNYRLVLKATKSGGLVMLIGMGPTDIILPLAEFANRQVDIRSGKGVKGHECFPTAIELVASGKYPYRKLITHRFQLAQTSEAFDLFARGAGVKVMIKVGERSGKK